MAQGQRLHGAGDGREKPFSRRSGSMVMAVEQLQVEWPFRSIRTATAHDYPKGQHVAGLLPILLPTNQLTINVVADVAGFPDLYINIIGS
jgi:hypothetical protein